MASYLWIDGATQLVTTTAPNLQGKSLLEVTIPDGIHFAIAYNSLTALQTILRSNNEQVGTMVVKITIGTP